MSKSSSAADTSSDAPPWVSFPKGATKTQILRAYRRWAGKLHPDHGGDKRDFQRLERWKQEALDELEARKKSPPQRNSDAPPNAEKTATQSPPEPRAPQPAATRPPEPPENWQAPQRPNPASHKPSPAKRSAFAENPWLVPVTFLVAVGGAGLLGTVLIGLIFSSKPNREPSRRHLPQSVKIVVAFPDDTPGSKSPESEVLGNQGRAVALQTSSPQPASEAGLVNTEPDLIFPPAGTGTLLADEPSTTSNVDSVNKKPAATAVELAGVIPTTIDAEMPPDPMASVALPVPNQADGGAAKMAAKVIFLITIHKFTTRDSGDFQKLIPVEIERTNVSPQAWNLQAGLSHYAFALELTKEEQEIVIRRFPEGQFLEQKEDIAEALKAVGLRVYPGNLRQIRRTR